MAEEDNYTLTTDEEKEEEEQEEEEIDQFSEGNDSGSETEEMEEEGEREDDDELQSQCLLNLALERVGQGNFMWHALRRQCVVTASEVGALFACQRRGFTTVNALLAEKRSGVSKKVTNAFTLEAMEHGRLREAEGLALFMTRIGKPRLGFSLTMNSPGLSMCNVGKGTLVGASPDALAFSQSSSSGSSGSGSGAWNLIEVKCPFGDQYGEKPFPAHYIQVQFTMGVLNRIGHRPCRKAYLVAYKSNQSNPTGNRMDMAPTLRVWEIEYSDQFWRQAIAQVNIFKHALDVGTVKLVVSKGRKEELRAFIQQDMDNHIKRTWEDYQQRDELMDRDREEEMEREVQWDRAERDGGVLIRHLPTFLSSS